jgi:hypothetical protein
MPQWDHREEAHDGAVTRDDAHVFFPYGDSTIVVNKYGHRVATEKAPYHVRTQAHFHWSGTEYPHLVQLMLYDQAVADEPTFVGVMSKKPADERTIEAERPLSPLLGVVARLQADARGRGILGIYREGTGFRGRSGPPMWQTQPIGRC